MLQNQINQFKEIAPELASEIFDNGRLIDSEGNEDYAVLTYSLPKPLPFDDVADIFDNSIDLIFGYELEPSYLNTLFGRCACVYSIPNTSRMFKINVHSNGLGMVEYAHVTIYDSLELMCNDLINEIQMQSKNGKFRSLRDFSKIIADFS